MASPVRYRDVLDALPRVRSVLRPTLLRSWPGLNKLLGFEFYLKHENHQPVGAFKVRGGVNLTATLSDRERGRGIVAVSTGNHGQSLAFASRREGLQCTIVVPRGNNPGKNEAMKGLGANLIEEGKDFDEARSYVENVLTKREGMRYVHSADEPLLIAGVGTMAYEIFEDLPDPDAILVPIGLGSSVCGTCIVAKHVRPQTEVIGVQAEGAPSVVETWRSGQWTTADFIDTFAEGIATRVPAEMTMDIMRNLMDDAMLVSDDEMRRAVWHILAHTRNLAEGSGAASLAAALKHKERFQGKKVVGILSGGNLDLSQLGRILSIGQST
uniref:Tryptophan synthase beta chain-like PALP domain-containing protein n=1 Tax=Odontella aurita TaxID=265563 RepID=A0A7S4I207_9STRA|mmetsp:Transcript_186/g.440  ORF Transcript_186/g.440 Transcript_186/m.440 type:complete len:326 (+) Transcript_186:244-1221(+)